MTVTYTDISSEFGLARRQFGISHNMLPALTVNLNSQQHIPYPESLPLTSDSIISFVTQAMKGEITPVKGQI